MKSLILLITILLITVINTFAQDGAPDTTFGSGDGLVYHSIFQDQPSYGYALLVQQDHKIVVVGSTKGADGNGHAFISRYNEDGSLDNSFSGSGIILPELPGYNSYSGGVKAGPDGKIIMCAWSRDSINRYITLLMFTEDGVPDNTFNEDGQASIIIHSDFMDISAMVLQADGKIVIGGYAGAFLTDSFMVVRFLSNGALDQSFGGDGIVITGVGEDYTDVNSLLVQPDGKIIACGYATFNGNEDFAIVRYNTNGTLDNTFSGDGIAHITISDSDDRSNCSVLQPDSKIVLGGYGHNNITGHESFAMARLNPDGTMDNSFHGDGIASIYITEYYDNARSMIRQPDGKFVLSGTLRAGASDYGFMLGLARITEDGVLDHTFDNDGYFMLPVETSIESQINATTLQPDGKIISTGFYRTGFLNQAMLFRTLTGLTTATEDVDQFIDEVSIYPNPVMDNMVLKYSIDEKENLSITLCDAMGRAVSELLRKTERDAGNHEEHLILPTLVPGNYFLKMETGSGIKTMLLIKE